MEATIVNRPVSFYHKYKPIIWQICFVFLAMVVTIAGLSYGLARARRSAERLRRSTNFISALLDAVPTAVFYKDRQGRYQGCNQIFTDIVGKTSTEIQGKTLFDLWPSDTTEGVIEQDLALMENPVHLTYEFRLTDKKGQDRDVIITKDVFRDENGEVIGLVGTFMDITERKKAEKNIQRLQNYLSNIINSMPSVLIAVDREGKVNQWNRTAESITGIKNKQAIGQPFAEVYPSLQPFWDKLNHSMQTNEPFHIQKKVTLVNGKPRYDDITIYPLITNSAEGAVIRIDDVTEQVHMEEMMVQSEKMLSVGGLAAGMAHEINNPLAGIMQTADVMETRLKKSSIPANVKAAEEVGITMADIGLYMEKRDIFSMLDAITKSGRAGGSDCSEYAQFCQKIGRHRIHASPVRINGHHYRACRHRLRFKTAI